MGAGKWERWAGLVGVSGPRQTRGKWHDTVALGLVFVGLLGVGSGVAVLTLRHLPVAAGVLLLAVGVPLTWGGIAYGRPGATTAGGSTLQPARRCSACRSTSAGPADVRCPGCGAGLR